MQSSYLQGMAACLQSLFPEGGQGIHYSSHLSGCESRIALPTSGALRERRFQIRVL